MLQKHLFDGIFTLLSLAAASAIFLLVAVIAGLVALVRRMRRAKVVAGSSALMAAGAGVTCLFLQELWDRNMATTEVDWRDVGAIPVGILFILGIVTLFRVR